MLNINHQGKANQNHNEIQLHIHQHGLVFCIFWLYGDFAAAHTLSLVADLWLQSLQAQQLQHSGSTVTELRLLLLQCMGLSVAEHRLSLYSMGAIAVVCRFSCPTACGILISRPRIEPVSPAMEGGFLTTGPTGKFPQGCLQSRRQTSTCKDVEKLNPHCCC